MVIIGGKVVCTNCHGGFCMWLVHRKIGFRLAYGFGIVVILTLFLGLFALRKMRTHAEVAVKIFEHPLVVSNAARDIRSEFR